MGSAALAEVYGGDVESRQSIFWHIENALKKSPHTPAAIALHQPASHLADLVGTSTSSAPRLTWTYSQLHQGALKLIAGLIAHGVEPGTRIATLIPNRVESQLFLWLSALFQVTLCPLDPGAATPYRHEELTSFLTSVQPEVIVVLDDVGAECVDKVLQNVKQPKVKIILERVSPSHPASQWQRLSDVANHGNATSIDEEELRKTASENSPDRIAMICFTSGTSTGKPKGCPRPVASFTGPLATYAWDTYTRSLVYTANFRIIHSFLSFTSWAQGGAVVIPDPSLGPKGIITAIRDHGVTGLVVIPALLFSLAADPDFASTDTSRVTNVRIGGDVISKDTLAKCQAAFPHAKASIGHGMTEAGGLVRWAFPDASLEDVPYFGDICPLGKVCPGARLRIRDPESLVTLKRNQPGELCVQSDGQIKNYLGGQHSEMFFKDETGRWFRTGDLAMINDDDVVYILGRLKDVIKRAGIPITPAALESSIERFVGSKTAVLAYPHPTLGQEPLPIVEELNGKTESEIQEHVVKMFGKDYAIGSVLTIQQLGLDAFPRNAMGKVMKVDLLKMVQGNFDKLQTT